VSVLKVLWAVLLCVPRLCVPILCVPVPCVPILWVQRRVERLEGWLEEVHRRLGVARHGAQRELGRLAAQEAGSGLARGAVLRAAGEGPERRDTGDGTEGEHEQEGHELSAHGGGGAIFNRQECCWCKCECRGAC